jgi:hypothetical protein
MDAIARRVARGQRRAPQNSFARNEAGTVFCEAG